nr:ribonuclease H-like domain-containing protein [Tanacetum cinerariifolium]
MAFVSTPGSTNEVDTANIQVSTVSTLVSIASSHDNTANLSDATIYAFLANQPNGSHLVHEDLDQIHEDDLLEMDLKWQLALLSMRARRYLQRTGKKITINGSDTAGYDKTKTKESRKLKKKYNVEETSSKAMIAINGARFNWSYMENDAVPTNMALTAFSDSEVQNNKTCSKTCLKSFETLKKQYDDLRVEFNKTEFDLANYKRGLFTPLRIDLSYSGLEEFQEPEFEAYGPKGDPHDALKDTGIFNSGYSWHMTGNKSYLTYYQEYDGGFVAFAGSSKGGKITGKGKIRTGKLDFEDVYFVKELKFNLFSVSQICDKQNSVLFTETECLIHSPNFKLPDESQVLLKVPRKNNIYSFDLKNIVPSKDLTCLIAKATNDESNLWHRRLGHINFKTLNKLVKGNLVRGLPSKIFNNDHSCVACQKGLKREFSNARTPQQNEVAKRKNRTLIEAARTMALVTKPHNKTPYELLIGRTPIISFMRPFGFPLTILSTLDHLVSAGNRNNYNACSEINSDAGQAGKKKVSDQEYILLPLLYISSYIPSSFEEAKSTPKDDGHKKENALSQENESDDQERPNAKSSTKTLNTAGPSINTANAKVNTGSLNFNTKSLSVNTATPIHADYPDDNHADPLMPDL